MPSLPQSASVSGVEHEHDALDQGRRNVVTKDREEGVRGKSSF